MSALNGRHYGGPLARAAGTLTVDALFHAQARRVPDQPAIVFGGTTLSYGALDRRVEALASALAAAGIERGDRIAILAENRPEYVELELACARLGAILACQNWRLVAAELTHCLGLVAPKLTFCSERHRGALDGLAGEFGRIVQLGRDYEALLAEAGSAAAPRAEIDPEDGLVILYTSGTTGMPKGAVISQRAMLARAQISFIDGPLEAGKTFIAWAPMFHMVSTDGILATLMAGGKVILFEGFEPAGIVAALDGEDLGWLQVLPGTLEPLIAELRRTGHRPAGVRVVGCMADLVPRGQLAELSGLVGAPFLNSFGSTETGTSPLSAGTIPIGTGPERLPKRLNSFCEIRLLDEEGQEVPDGEPGEIAVRSPTLFSGYWGRPDDPDFRGGWFHMGDVLRRNPDGAYEFVDRRKYLIKSGGENIYPAEIEQALLASPRIADVAVVRAPHPRWSEVPVAFVVAADPSLTADEVVALCRGRIANYKLPKGVRFIAEPDLPRSSTGKIKRHELEARLAEDPIEFPA